MHELLDWGWGSKNRPLLPSSEERCEAPARTAGASKSERLNLCVKVGQELVKRLNLPSIRKLLTSERRNNPVFESEREKGKPVFHHHQFAYCPKCGKWYEIQWDSDGSQILTKTEFELICVRCGEFVRSKGYVDLDK